MSLECCFQWSNGHKLHQGSASPYLYKVAVNVIRGKTGMWPNQQVSEDTETEIISGPWLYWDVVDT